MQSLETPVSRVDDLKQVGDLTMSELRKVGGVTVGKGFGERLQRALQEERDRSTAVDGDLALAVVETAHEAFVGMSAEGTITAWNPAAEQTLGWKAEEVIGRDLAETIIPEQFREPHRRGLERLLRTGKGPIIGKRIELAAIHKDGHQFPIEITISAIQAKEGWSFHAFLHDITDRRREEEIRLRAERYRELQLAVAQVLAASTTPDEALPRVLRAMGDGLNWDVAAHWAVEPDGLLRCSDFWHKPGRHVDPFRKQTRDLELPVGEGLPGRVAQSGEPIRIDDVTIHPNFTRTESAQAVGLRTAVAAPLFREDKVVGVLEFFTSELWPPDYSLIDTLAVISSQVGQFIARREAEQEAERMKDEFFSLVSHELRTPLTSVLGYTDMLEKKEGSKLSPQGRKMIGVIRRNAKRELRLVGDLLMLVRIESGRFELQPGAVDLPAIAAESIEAAQPAAEKRRMTVKLSAEAISEFDGDPDRVAQVIDNLLSNAIKFTPEGGSVDLRVSKREATAVIEVEDSGEGIPSSDQQRLFDRLYRASKATETHVPGTGLGLTIVKAISEAHGGRVLVESEVGKGTTFRVELPIRPVRDGVGSPPPRASSPAAPAPAAAPEAQPDASRPPAPALTPVPDPPAEPAAPPVSAAQEAGPGEEPATNGDGPREDAEAAVFDLRARGGDA